MTASSRSQDHRALTSASTPIPSQTLRTADDLVTHGLISSAHSDAAARVAARYAVAVTPAMAALIDRADPNDPIARQFVPDARELHTLPQEREDPIGDHPHSPTPGLVHRYRDRVLLKVTHVCPVYCRFCFRREMVGPLHGEALTAEDLAAALAYIRTHPEIWEVILTGGDPFMLSPRRMREVTAALAGIPHVRVLRWHTRVPVVDPARVTEDLIDALTAHDRTLIVAVHTNHARELTALARAALAKLADAGASLVSQTVLLKGINDTATTLEELMRTLITCRIKPYYLHHGDLAPGTAHLRTTIDEGQALMDDLARRLSGIALPRYVLDIPGGHGKVEIASHVTPLGDGTYRVRAPDGTHFTYCDPVDRNAPGSPSRSGTPHA